MYHYRVCLILFFLSFLSQISMVSLAPVIRRNCKLNCLRTAGCRSLLLECDNVEHISGNKYKDFLQEVGTTSCLEDVEMGWGFCPIRIEDLVPSFSKVRKMTIGLGTALAENVMCALPMICPFLESLILRFQVCPNTLQHVKYELVLFHSITNWQYTSRWYLRELLEIYWNQQ
jgi:hypothetical protein